MSLSSALHMTSNALSAFERALSVTQNNVSNASTPGYVKQTATFEALPFESDTGESGGVTTGPVESSRNQYAEQTVRYANSQLGSYQQQVQSLTDLQNQFDISGASGVPGALSSLYNAFSAWSNNPNDTTARQGVLTAAGSLADAFQQTSANVSQVASETVSQVGSLADQVNTLANEIAKYNSQLQQGDPNDPAIDASINSTLQDLSQIANITTTNHPNGTVDVMLGGQVELVSGTSVNKLSSDTYTPTSAVAVSGNTIGTPLTITSGKNDTLNLNMDGGLQSNPPVPALKLTLSSADTSIAAVASDINTQLAAQGSSATAREDAQGRLVITSWSSSANAGVQVLSGNANSTLGLITSAPPTVRIEDSNGIDVTSKITQGSLAGALTVINQSLPAIQGDSSRTGSLNQLATSFADRVNSLIGMDLFTYDKTNAVNGANTLQVNSSITASDLPSPPVTSLTGTAVTGALTISNTPPNANNQLDLAVDGKTWPAITLNTADATLSDVANDLNQNFSTLGIGAYASLNGNTGALTISTTGTGSNAAVQVLSAGTANATVGLSSTTPASASVATVTGAAVGTPFVIASLPVANNKLNLAVDGTSYSVTLNPLDTTVSDVAIDLNKQFATLGIKAGASTNAAGGLIISTTGNNASLQVLSGSANNTIGLSSPVSTQSQTVNSIALSLAGLETPNTSSDEVNGQSYTAFFGSIASGVGSQLSTATTGQSTQQDVLNQAVSLRQQISGVDLNAEATQIVQIQSAYSALAKMVTVIDDMTQTVLGLVTRSSVM
jgi:flagellar hook-associated protein 1 FlgK